ncbi:FG-GAP-like repeat-containing protein [Bacteroidota bacterium]
MRKKNSVIKCFVILTFLVSLAFCLNAQIPQVLWYYDVNDMSFGNAAIGDIDEDDKLEIVFSCYRNDSSVYALNAEDGSLLWKKNTGGCNDVAPLIYDVDMDNHPEVIVPSSCVAKTFCLNGLTGNIEWEINTHGSDSPPTVADVDNDGKPEILHGEFGGYVICINGENGSQSWEINVDPNSWIQTAPAILDLDQNGQLDFVVANWNFDTAHRIFAYRGDNHNLIWETTLPDDVMYHGTSFADIDQDGKPELVIGSYDATLYVLNGEDGSLLWSYQFTTPSSYIGSPTSIADLDNDGRYEIVFFDWYKLGVLSDSGSLKWSYTIPGFASSFRGAAISDIDGDDTLDVVFGTSLGEVIALNGSNGDLIWSFDLSIHYGSSFDIDHGPVIADFNNDSIIDVFLVGGHAEYPNTYNNYGRAYALKAGVGEGPAWPMFRRDVRRSACVSIDTATSIIESKNDYIPYFGVFPNPFSHEVNIHIGLKESSDLVINVYDIRGRLVKVIMDKKLNNGIHKVRWKGNDHSGHFLPSGCYIIEFKTKNKNYYKKVSKSN